MVTRQKTKSTFGLSGGRVCLDFVNTVGDRGSDLPIDRFRSYRDFVVWAEQAGAVPARVVSKLVRLASADLGAAQRSLAKAIALRESLYRLFAAIAAGQDPHQVDLAALNERVPSAFARSRLTKASGGFVLEADPASDDLSSPLPTVVKSAVDLLTSSDVDRIRICAADTCRWLFIDMTKNRSRRWCEMKTCGNRAKARRFRERT